MFNAKEAALEEMTITAQISVDREAAMSAGRGGGMPGEGVIIVTHSSYVASCADERIMLGAK